MNKKETAEAIIVVGPYLWKCVNCNLLVSRQHSIDEHLSSQHGSSLKPQELCNMKCNFSVCDCQKLLGGSRRSKPKKSFRSNAYSKSVITDSESNTKDANLSLRCEHLPQTPSQAKEGTENDEGLGKDTLSEERLFQMKEQGNVNSMDIQNRREAKDSYVKNTVNAQVKKTFSDDNVFISQLQVKNPSSDNTLHKTNGVENPSKDEFGLVTDQKITKTSSDDTVLVSDQQVTKTSSDDTVLVTNQQVTKMSSDDTVLVTDQQVTKMSSDDTVLVTDQQVTKMSSDDTVLVTDQQVTKTSTDDTVLVTNQQVTKTSSDNTVLVTVQQVTKTSSDNTVLVTDQQVTKTSSDNTVLVPSAEDERGVKRALWEPDGLGSRKSRRSNKGKSSYYQEFEMKRC